MNRDRVTAATSASPAQQLAAFIAKFDPAIGRLVRAARSALRKRLPSAIEQVYDNYNFLAIGFSSTERTSDTIASLAVSAKGVALSFYRGASLPEQLVEVQKFMAKGDERAGRIYETIGTYLGYAVAHYADFYDFKHLLLLGRVTTGTGGSRIVERAKEVLAGEFPELAKKVTIHLPDEKEKRHGQAVAAASLPALKQ